MSEGDFYISGSNGGDQFVYAPKDDMTPVEATWIAGLFVLAGGSAGRSWHKYLVKYGIERHFTAVP